MPWTLKACTIDDAEALTAFTDAVLRTDYFFRRRHWHDLLTNQKRRPATCAVYAATAASQIVAIAIVYEKCLLWNLYVDPAHRREGLGTWIIDQLRPATVRVKTNMSTGDPRPFYRSLGYIYPGTATKRRATIAVMSNVHGDSGAHTGDTRAALDALPVSLL